MKVQQFRECLTLRPASLPKGPLRKGYMLAEAEGGPKFWARENQRIVSWGHLPAFCSYCSMGTKPVHLIIYEAKNGNLDNKEGTQEPYPTQTRRMVLCL